MKRKNDSKAEYKKGEKWLDDSTSNGEREHFIIKSEEEFSPLCVIFMLVVVFCCL